MDLFSAFNPEPVKIIKQDHSVIENVQALIDPNEIFIDDGSLDIEEGDIIERVLPNGKKEEYLVEESSFYKGMFETPDHYQLKVRKQSSYLKARDAYSNSHVVNNYNISNAGKVNIQSTDNSTTVNITKNNDAVMDELRSRAKGLENENEILKNIDEMQKNLGKPSALEKYNNLIQSFANHMTIFGPFIPALTKMLLG